MNKDLPVGWIEAELKDFVLYRKGKKPSTSTSVKKKGYIPYLLIDEMEGKPIRSYTNDTTVPVANPNDVLVVWDGSIGKTATGLKGAIGSTIAALTPVLISSNFLEYFLKTAKPFIEQTSRGTGLQHINPDSFWLMPFPLPPLNEQKRIVAKLDKIFSRISLVKDRFDRFPSIIKRFRQSVLTAAVIGKLTQKWREQNINMEKADVLVKRIRKEQEIKYREECSKALKKGWRKPDKPNNFNYDLSQYMSESEVDSTWTNIVIGALADCIVPGRDKPKSFTGIIPWITLPDIKNNSIINRSDHPCLSDSEISKVGARIIPPKSVIISVIGRFGIAVVNDIPIVINQQLHGFKPNDAYIPKYLSYHLRVLEKHMERISTSTTIAYLNKANANSFPINLPPYEEQKEIVRQVEKLFSLADKLEEHYKLAKVHVDKLSHSLLAKAFRGELVPQDPNDEPAEKLLEQILLQKAKFHIKNKKS